MNRLAILNVVGLSKKHLGEHTPNITSLANKSSVHTLNPPLPAVTSTVQSTLLTGLNPSGHGLVANDWHDRDTSSTHFGRLSNSLGRGQDTWDAVKSIDPNFTCSHLLGCVDMYPFVIINDTQIPLYYIYI